MEERTERESGNRRREEKWQTLWCFRDQLRACRMAQASAKNLSILGLLKRKQWSQCYRESSWQVRRSRLCQNKKEQSRLSRAPNHEGERVNVGESRTLAREGGSERWQIPRRKGRASKKSLPRRSKRKHERVSGHKSSAERSGESWFHSKSGQTRNKKRRLGDEEPAYKVKV